MLFDSKLIRVFIACFPLVVLTTVPPVFAQSANNESVILRFDNEISEATTNLLRENGVLWSGVIGDRQALASIPKGQLNMFQDKFSSINAGIELFPTAAEFKLKGVYDAEGRVPQRYKNANGLVSVIVNLAPGNDVATSANALRNLGYQVQTDMKVNGVLVYLAEDRLKLLAQEKIVESISLAPGFPSLN